MFNMNRINNVKNRKILHCYQDAFKYIVIREIIPSLPSLKKTEIAEVRVKE